MWALMLLALDCALQRAHQPLQDLQSNPIEALLLLYYKKKGRGKPTQKGNKLGVVA